MSYYREQFVNESYTDSTSSVSTVLDSASVLSFRSRTHPKALTSELVGDHDADPYAYFLDSTSRKKYQARLKERGLPSQGAPDRGHAFAMTRHTIKGTNANVRLARYPDNPGAEGFAFLVPSQSAHKLDHIHRGNAWGVAPYKESGLDAFAQLAYNRTAPSSVIFDAAQFLGELREGLPKLIPSLLKSNIRTAARNYGKDYLNAEFGWKPIISDVQNAAKALASATVQLSQNGQRVHRKYSIPEFSENDLVTFSGLAGIYSGHKGVLSPAALKAAGMNNVTTGGYNLPVETYHRKDRTVHRWFEGEFSSFFPLGFDPTDYFSRLKVLTSTNITPSVLWELAPWSWLIDWQLRIGDTIAANEKAANDLLVMHYGYAMETAVYKTRLLYHSTATPRQEADFVGYPKRAFLEATTTYKQRLRANPYGFKVQSSGDLTVEKLAILAALGLTKT